MKQGINWYNVLAVGKYEKFNETIEMSTLIVVELGWMVTRCRWKQVGARIV